MLYLYFCPEAAAIAMSLVKGLALTCLCLAVVHLSEAKVNGHAAWFPSLRLLFKHSDLALAGIGKPT